MPKMSKKKNSNKQNDYWKLRGGLSGEENEGHLDGSGIEMGPEGRVDLGLQK